MKRHSLTLLILLSLVVSIPTQAQRKSYDRKFDYSLMAGLNMSQIDGDNSGKYSKMGFHGAVNTSFPLGDSEAWRFLVEIGFTQKGSYSSNIDRTIALSYVEVPLMINYNMADDRFRIGAGVAPAILAKSHVDDSGVEIPSQSANYRRLDAIPLCVDLRFMVTGGFAIEARYYNSMLTCAKESGSGTYRIFRSNKGQFNRLVTIGIAYCL